MRRHRRRVLGAEDYDAEVRFFRKTATFMGIWPLPNANSLDVIKRVSKEMESIRRSLRAALEARWLRRYQLHLERDPGGAQDLGDTLLTSWSSSSSSSDPSGRC